MRKEQTSILVAALLLSGPASAIPITVDVFAQANSSTGGTGVSVFALTAGQDFSVSVDPGDLWNAGALPRWSNADGLVGTLLATGSDESGAAAGTVIGALFSLHTQGGLTAPFGSLVGRIGGVFQLLGTSFSGPAWNTGTLELFYWDSNSSDNSDSVRITAEITPTSTVPEPLSLGLVATGLGTLGALRSHRARRAT
ncbi:MAG: hypothetical protein AB7O21_17950 [Gammaproteobacteria bacterium]